MSNKILVKKAHGELEPFLVAKLRRSMEDSGAPSRLIAEVIKDVQSRVKHGISTTEIHNLAFSLLKKASKSYAARYNLKKAIMRLGPDGFPFEKYFAALLNHSGYVTSTNVVLNGACITHEVDIVAEKNEKNIHAIIEAKFHGRPGKKTGSKDALYTHGRFLDIQKNWQNQLKKGAKPKNGKLQSWLVTNTEMTTNALKYCKCVGMEVVAWSYPDRHNSLQGMIHHKGLYPVSSILTLTNEQKKTLMKRGVIICGELIDNRKVLTSIGLKKGQIEKVLLEVSDLCSQYKKYDKKYHVS